MRREPRSPRHLQTLAVGHRRKNDTARKTGSRVLLDRFVTLFQDFINILRTPFSYSYESAFWSFSLVTIWLCNFLVQKISVQKVHVKCKWNWLKVAFDGGYDPCNNATFFLGQDSKRKKRKDSEPCDPGFVADLDNGYCYFGYKEGTLSVSNGKDFCKSLSAELLAFENDAQIVGFLKLISSGKQFQKY